jgi:ethanolaminephosphotransferase
MSNTASNYNVSKLVIGQVVATAASALAFIAVVPTLSHSLISATPFLLIILAYGIMMFASSYVEEEQHFWYWAASAWLLLLYLKR